MKIIYPLFLSILFAFASPVWSASVNINTADAVTLQKSLTGVGKVRAQAIVEYREKNGPFEYVDDVLKVEGVGRTTLEVNRENISIN